MTWALLGTALAFLLYAVLSRRLAASVLSAPIYFLGIGAIFGLLGVVDMAPGELSLGILAEATLTVVLFTDASSIEIGQLRAGWKIPARLLSVGLVLTIVAGVLAAIPIFPGLPIAEALILAVCLAPTDAALGLPVVVDQRVPGRIRQALNVESGLNDGICVPLLFVALALALAEGGEATPSAALLGVVEELAAGVLAGLVIGGLGAYAARLGRRAGTMGAAWGQMVPLAAAVGAYGLAVPLGGSGFIAAFVGGAAFGILGRRWAESAEPAAEVESHPNELLEVLGSLLTAATFLAFGAGILIPLLGAVRPEHIVYAVLSLTAIRMLPVALSLIRSRARPPTVAFIGWFGPRGLASIVFAVIVLEEAPGLAGLETITVTVAITVFLSVVAHGLSAWPLAGRYGAWFVREAAASPELMEGTAVTAIRPRGAVLVPRLPGP
jgi:NhaP-type Na+/H+ or K+/H+ antiporter